MHVSLVRDPLETMYHSVHTSEDIGLKVHSVYHLPSLLQTLSENLDKIGKQHISPVVYIPIATS